MKKLFAFILVAILCFTSIPSDLKSTGISPVISTSISTEISTDTSTEISKDISAEYEFAKLQNGAGIVNSFDNKKLTEDSSVIAFNDLREDSFVNGAIVQGVYTINNTCELPKALIGKELDLSAAYFKGDGELIISGGTSIKGYCGSLKVVVDSTQIVKISDSKFEGVITPKTATKFCNSVFDEGIIISSDYSSLEKCSAGDVKVGGKNILIACTDISGSLEINGGYNCSVVENSVIGNVNIIGGNFISIAENELKSALPINTSDTKNLLINNNTSSAKPIFKQSGKTVKIYGNDVEVKAKAGAGANEALLPQRDNSRFIGMKRFTNVIVENKEMPVKDYLSNSYSEGNTVIIPPGVYSIPKGVNEHILFKNLTKYQILAYGVEFILEDYGQTGIFIQGCDTLRIKGLTEDHNEPGNTQGTVLKRTKLYGGYLVVKIDTGYPTAALDGNTTQMEFYKPKYDYSYTRTWFGGVEKISNGVYGIFGSNRTVGEVGDKFIAAGRTAHVYLINESSAIHFEDVTVYDGSAFAFLDAYGNKATVLNRAAVTTGPKPARATAERLKSTRDATHSVSMREGMKVFNCVFEKMSDDGANMCGSYGDITKFDTKTKTITYKNGTSSSNSSNTADFAIGDSVWIYTIGGKFICDAKATSATKNGTVKIDKTFKMPAKGTIVLIENASRNGNGFVYDNCLIRKQMPRGLIIKASNGVVRNCTLANNGKSGILIYPEVSENWGESGFATNIIIENNLIINSSYYDNLKYDGTYQDRSLFTPITVKTDSKPSSDPAYQNQKNIKILNNVIKNRNTTYAVYIAGAMNVEIKGNDFGIRAKTRFGKAQNSLASKNDDTAPSVCIKGSTNVTVKDNIYPKSAKVKVVVDKLSKNLKIYDLSSISK